MTDSLICRASRWNACRAALRQARCIAKTTNTAEPIHKLHSIAIYGFMQSPHMAFQIMDNPQMDIASVIAYNLSAWMDASANLGTIKALSKASGVGFGTVRRAKNGDGNITVQNLEAIARAFKRKAIDLLAAPNIACSTAPPTEFPTAQEPPPEENELMQGFRAASPEAREIMLDVARRYTKSA